MVYNPNIPLVTDDLSTSQSDIKNNFSTANTSFGVDHVTFSDLTGDSGKHSATTYVNLTDKVLPVPTTTAQEIAMYVKDDAAGAPRLFYREPSSGTEQQLSNFVKNSANGESWLAGGVGIKWGTISVPLTKTVEYVADFGLNAFVTDTFSVVLNPINKNATIGNNEVAFVIAKSNVGFTAQSKISAVINYYWIAIGL